MQERRLRLGDVLDDYCPREKRLTNHVIVALVEDDVRQTRCSTCDHEHVYKGGKAPARRKKAEPQAVLYKTVLEGITGRDADTDEPLTRVEVESEQPAPPIAPPAAVPVAVPAVAPVAAAPAAAVPPRAAAPPAAPAVVPPAPVSARAVPVPAAPVDTDDVAPATGDEPVHRHQLIRATLPKIDGQVPERKPADFTLWNVSRQPQPRRGGGGGGGRPRPQGQNAGQGSGAQWGGYSPYANGHPGGKAARPGPSSPGRPPRQHGSSDGSSNSNSSRRGR
ncbi:MAG: hypothetical protein ACR2LU_06235 [Luteitalea sp.]